MSNTDSSKRRRFAIALSFPGERREYVEQVANARRKEELEDTEAALKNLEDVRTQ
jgi:hypothetical protein